MHASQENWEDVKRYYLGTYVKFKEEGDTLLYIERVDPDKIVAKTTNGDLCGIDLTVPGGYNIDYVIPKKTVFQYGEVVAMLSRIPARMWKKGMSKENTRFEVLDKTGKWNKVSFNAQIIEAFIHKPVYMTPDEAVTQFKKGEAAKLEAAALTPRISMTNVGKIMVDQTIIAKYDMEKNVIACKVLFIPEIKELFPFATIKSVK